MGRIILSCEFPSCRDPHFLVEANEQSVYSAQGFNPELREFVAITIRATLARGRVPADLSLADLERVELFGRFFFAAVGGEPVAGDCDGEAALRRKSQVYGYV